MKKNLFLIYFKTVILGSLLGLHSMVASQEEASTRETENESLSQQSEKLYDDDDYNLDFEDYDPDELWDLPPSYKEIDLKDRVFSWSKTYKWLEQNPEFNVIVDGYGENYKDCPLTVLKGKKLILVTKNQYLSVAEDAANAFGLSATDWDILPFSILCESGLGDGRIYDKVESQEAMRKKLVASFLHSKAEIIIFTDHSELDEYLLQLQWVEDKVVAILNNLKSIPDLFSRDGNPKCIVVQDLIEKELDIKPEEQNPHPWCYFGTYNLLFNKIFLTFDELEVSQNKPSFESRLLQKSKDKRYIRVPSLTTIYESDGYEDHYPNLMNKDVVCIYSENSVELFLSHIQTLSENCSFLREKYACNSFDFILSPYRDHFCTSDELHYEGSVVLSSGIEYFNWVESVRACLQAGKKVVCLKNGPDDRAAKLLQYLIEQNSNDPYNNYKYNYAFVDMLNCEYMAPEENYTSWYSERMRFIFRTFFDTNDYQEYLKRLPSGMYDPIDDPALEPVRFEIVRKICTVIKEPDKARPVPYLFIFEEEEDSDTTSDTIFRFNSKSYSR